MSIDNNGFKAEVDAQKISQTGIVGKMLLGSRWAWEHWRKFDGVYKKLSTWEEPNIMCDAGINYVMDAAFSGLSPISSWYLVTFEDDYTPLATNTYASPGYTECTAITEATRPAWSEAGVASKIITNSASKATFTYNATKTIYGGALVGGGSAPSTKGDTAGGGVLICSSQFTTGNKPVVDTDILKVTVTITGSNVV